MLDLSLIWAGLIATAVLLYVTLDGFDLGIGILFPFARSKEDRDVMMNTVAPVWDGNETWLVLGGGGLFAAFPLAYAVILPATYPLIVARLRGRVFRGVAFQFRWRRPRHRAIRRTELGGSADRGACPSGQPDLAGTPRARQDALQRPALLGDRHDLLSELPHTDGKRPRSPGNPDQGTGG